MAPNINTEPIVTYTGDTRIDSAPSAANGVPADYREGDEYRSDPASLVRTRRTSALAVGMMTALSMGVAGIPGVMDLRTATGRRIRSKPSGVSSDQSPRCPGRERNQLCPCGSGKKRKRCGCPQARGEKESQP